MEIWQNYEKELRPLPLDASYVRRIDLTDWEQTGTEQERVIRGILTLTEEEAANPLLLRVCQAGCKGEIFEDGEAIGSHYGSFTDWELPLKKNGKTSREIKIVLREDKGNVSPFEKAAFYGGLFLISLPKISVKELSLDTGKQEETFFLKASVGLEGETETGCTLKVCIKTEDGTTLAEEKREVSGKETQKFYLPCKEAAGWETDDPILYNCIVSVWKGTELLQTITNRVGFRKIEIKGTQVFWNDRPLKLRGLCYREPLGADRKRFLRRDLELFRKAGVQYLKSLYYPFSQEALCLCDELGILTEQSASAYQVGKEGRATQDLPDYQEAYAGQCSEMVKGSRNHVSVLLFSLGSESVWGNNFRLCAKMTRALAEGRLLNFSYPMTIPKEDLKMDVWSVLYVDYKQPFDVPYDHMIIGHANGSDNEIGYVTGHSRRGEQPILHEIYAHLPCYNREEIRRDYGIHEFWGKSMQLFQEKMEETKGALGGSVMAAYDEDGSFSPLLLDCGFGVLDVNHDPKPEYEHLKQAFTGGKKAVREERSVWPIPKETAGSPYEILEKEDKLICKNKETEVWISKTTGRLEGLWHQGKKFIEEGPFLHMEKLIPGEWLPKAPAVKKTDKGVEIFLSGSLKDTCDVEFCLSLTKGGILETAYRVDRITVSQPPRVKAQIGLDPGGLDELGISYVLPIDFSSFSWEKEGIWETYPEDHIGRTKGRASLADKKDFESMKHQIRRASLTGETSGKIQIFPQGSCSIRLKEEAKADFRKDDRDEKICLKGHWYAMDDNAGNWKGTETLSRTKGDTLEYTFEGTGIVVYGPVDHIGGLYRVWVDETLVSEGSSYPKPVDILAASRGYEKLYQMPMARVEDLPRGSHTVKVEVLGEKAFGGNDTWVSVDYLEVLDGEKSRQLRLICDHGCNYTRLVRGNYMEEPVKMEPGKWFRVVMQLEGKETPNDGTDRTGLGDL